MLANSSPADSIKRTFVGSCASIVPRRFIISPPSNRARIPQKARPGRSLPRRRECPTTVSNKRFNQLYTLSAGRQPRLQRFFRRQQGLGLDKLNYGDVLPKNARPGGRGKMDALEWLRDPSKEPIRPVYAVFGDDSYLIRESITGVANTVLPDEDRRRGSVDFRDRRRRWPRYWMRFARSLSFCAGGWSLSTRPTRS